MGRQSLRGAVEDSERLDLRSHDNSAQADAAGIVVSMSLPMPLEYGRGRGHHRDNASCGLEAIHLFERQRERFRVGIHTGDGSFGLRARSGMLPAVVVLALPLPP